MREYKGNDNYGNPKSDYLKKIAAMTNDELKAEASRKIWLSAYAGNNPRSDFHWHVDAIWDECDKRDKNVKGGIYQSAYNETFKAVS